MICKTIAIIVPRPNPKLDQPIQVQQPRTDLDCFVIDFHPTAPQDDITKAINTIAARYHEHVIYNEPGFIKLLETSLPE